MTELFPSLLAAWQAVTTLEAVSVVFGLLYVILAARENIACWPAALVNTATAVVLFWQVDLLMESALNVFYFAIAIYGWHHWRYGGKHRAALLISSWQLRRHIYLIAIIVGLSAISGWALDQYSSAAYPYIDSFTTWAAVITTWMVTRKILQNWLYWIVIDLVGIWLMWQKELYLYAVLFFIYTLIALYGFRQWRRNYVQAAA